jgi:hypothetical protein
MTTKKLGALCATALALALAFPMTAHATEPLDNTAPWATSIPPAANNNVTTYISNGSPGWGGGSTREISTSTDVDYAVIACGKAAGKLGYIQDVRVGYTHSAGHDIDISVYRPYGEIIASSTGVTGFEKVDVTALNLNSIVLKVYGFSGGTGMYSITMVCR